jgi:Bacterial extracellular solute-binding protein
LVIFSEGNQFPVLLPLALDGLRNWLRQKGRALPNDNIVILTLPQSMLISALQSGGIAFGATIIPVDRTDGLWPDVVMAGDKPLRKLSSDGVVAPAARRFARSRGMSFLVRAGDPLGLHSVQDLADRRARVVLATSREAEARQQYLGALSLLAGPETVRQILGNEVTGFPGRLGIQHRDVPFAVANRLADAGLLVHHLALYYAATYPAEFEVVSLPGAEQRSADIYAAVADHPRNAAAAEWFLEFFFSRAHEEYEISGFAEVSAAEFGETLPLPPPQTGGTR